MENEIFEKTPVPKAYMTMAMPVVMSMVVSLIYNMVDTFFIARTGNTYLVAGVSLGAPMFTAMIALGDILGLGGSSLISRLFGQKEEEEARRISSFCFWGAVAVGFVIAILLLFFRNSMLMLLGADTDTYQYASQYYTYLVFGSPFIILYFTPVNQLRSEGFAKESMIGSILGVVINIILDPIFIFGLGFGAAGAAIATVIGYVGSDAYFVWFYLKKSKKLSINIRECKISGEWVKQILLIGIPSSITNFTQSFAVTMTNRQLLAYGSDKVAAMGIVMKVSTITAMVIIGFSFGGQALVGYNYGANNKKRLKEILSFAYRLECGLALVLAGALSIAARPMIRIFMDTKEIVDAGVVMLRFQQLGMLFIAIVMVSTCTFQAVGNAVGAFLLSVSRQGVIFFIVVMIAPIFLGYYGVLVAQPISDVLTALMAVILMKRSKMTA